MCRNIRTLFNFEPAVTDDEIRAASLQFVRKLSGFNKPSKANEAAFERAVDETAAVARRLLDSLTTTAAPRDRMVERERARQRNAESGENDCLSPAFVLGCSWRIGSQPLDCRPGICRANRPPPPAATGSRRSE